MTQVEKIKEFERTIALLNEEILRSKLWVNTHGYDVGTSVNFIVRNYRKELKLLAKELRAIVGDLYEDLY